MNFVHCSTFRLAASNMRPFPYLIIRSTGYPGFIVARPLFYDLLLSQIPASKIHFGKRVDTILETNDKVEVHTTTGETFVGDILVGADGAYSSIRKGLYERLKNEGRLPESDQEDLPFRCTCLVGQTEPLDLEVYSQLKDPLYPFYTTIGDDKRFIVSHLYYEEKKRNLSMCDFYESTNE